MRPKNEAKHAAYRQAFALLKEKHPLLTRTQLIDRMHELSGVPVATIRYYLREPKDLRRRYSPEDVERLSVASPKELAEEAIKRGISVSAIRSVVGRQVSRLRRSPTLQKEAKLKAELMGHFAWSDGFALNGFGLTRRSVQTARRLLLSSPWALDLREPNYLAHPATGRRIALTLPEQLVIVQDPIKFVRGYAKQLGSRWEQSPEVTA